MNSALQIGVVGCGYWGPNLVRNFDSLPSVNVAAVCDLDLGRLSHVLQRYSGLKGYQNFTDLLQHEALDAVVIATPVASHFKLAQAALYANKHVLLEKPMATSSEECETLIQLARKRGLVLMVGHTYLFSNAIQRVIEIVKSGELGELRYINSQRLSLGLFQKDVNVAWDLAPHDLSIIMAAVDDVPIVVNCQGNANVTPGVEDVVNLSLKFRNQTFATIQNSWLEPRKVRQLTFVGTQRTIIYDDLEPRDKVRIYDVRVDRPPHYDSFGDFQYAYHYGDTYIPRIEQSEPLRNLCENFVSCIQTGSQPLTCGQQGLDVIRVLEAASESLQNSGGAVPFSRRTPSRKTDSDFSVKPSLAGKEPVGAL